MMNEDILTVGTRVVRLGAYDDSQRHGVVVASTTRSSRNSHYDYVVYAVRWDDASAQVSNGYLRLGLERESLLVAP